MAISPARSQRAESMLTSCITCSIYSCNIKVQPLQVKGLTYIVWIVKEAAVGTPFGGYYGYT